jgi:hypothetical protein
VRVLADLPSANPSVQIGDIDLIELEGEETECGWDGEPIVRPSLELRRLRLAGGGRMMWSRVPLADSVEGLVAAGWVEQPTMAVK